MVALIIIKNLIKTASYYFTNKIIPKSFKKFIIVTLRKKKIYSLPSNYRLIALKNMLVKVLKKHIANIILKATEKYRLLP